MFEKSRQKLARAMKHIEELERVTENYQNSNFCELTLEKTSEGKDLIRLKITRPAPEEIPLIIGDAAHNIRSALDIMVCDMVMADGGGLTNSTQLRTAVDRHKYEKEHFGPKGALTALRPTARQLILDELKPFKTGGNPVLMGLHRLDIDDKHTKIIAIIDVVQAVVPTRLKRSNEIASPDIYVTFRSHQQPPDLRELAPDVQPIGNPRVSGVAVTFGYLGPFAQQGTVQVLRQLHTFASGTLQKMEVIYAT